MREHMEVEVPRTIPCPFVYSRGKQCPGHIVRVEAYKADLEWNFRADDAWFFGWTPRSHYHLFCSEKDNHAGANREDDPRLSCRRFEQRQFQGRRLR